MSDTGDSKRVEVYRNLNFGCFSVRALGGKHKGLVIDHVIQITLQNASFVVQPAGNRRVKAEKRKNVHAFVCGQLVETYGSTIPWHGGKKIFSNDFQVVYNPYKYKTFIKKDSGESILESYKYTLINNKEIWVGDWMPALTM